MNPLRITALLLTLLASAPAAAQDPVLRPIDRSTVRVFNIESLDLRTSSDGYVSANTGGRFGSGLAVAPDLVVTAAHVIRGGAYWTVSAPDDPSRVIAAHPEYVHPELDIAVLRLAEPVAHHARLGRPRSLRLGERLGATGYPLDTRETAPGAVAGELSRVLRDGLLQLSMNVNGGHSGGPVFDRRGRPVGMVIRRGGSEHGVEGIAYAIALSELIEAVEQLAGPAHVFTDDERLAARIVSRTEGAGGEPLTEEGATSLAREQLAASTTAPGADALVAAAAWNAAVSMDAARDGRGEPTAVERELREAAQRLAQRALAGPLYMRNRYPVLPAIARGRLRVPVAATRPGIARRAR